MSITGSNILEAEQLENIHKDKEHIVMLETALKEVANQIHWSRAQDNMINHDNCLAKAIVIIKKALRNSP